MKCPVDQAELVMSERQGVEIDYCPKCRGVWLDRGELDKIMEKAARLDTGGEAPRREESRPRESRDEDYRRGKRRSWLSELFD